MKGKYKIAIYGAGGLGKEMAMLIRQINKPNAAWEQLGYFDDNVSLSGAELNNLKVLGGLNELQRWNESLALIIAIADPFIKRKIYESITNKNIWFPTLIHPSAICGDKINIGEGSVITAGNILTEDIYIGRHVLLNLQCTVGHDAYIGDFCSIMPSVNISGEVRINEMTFVGTGVKINNSITVGERVVIGSGAAVTKDIPPSSLAAGVPAKVINPIKRND